LGTILLIEGALEEFKRDILPEITYDILSSAQNKEKETVKKRRYQNAMVALQSK